MERRDQGDAQQRAHDDPDDRTEHGQDHRLGADHRPDLPAFHPDGPQQPDLVGSLEHREHERVHNADQRDEDGQGEQRVDQAQQLVHLVRLRLLELGPALHLDVGVRRRGPA